MTNLHGKAAEINPADYLHLGDFYQGDSEQWHDVYQDDHKALDLAIREHGFELEWGELGGPKCQHCGTRYNHGAVYLHTPTHTLIAVGQTCSANTFSHRDQAALAQYRLRKAHERAVENARIAAEAKAFAEQHPDVIAHLERFAPTNTFYADLLAKLARYGSLSERQVEAVLRNVERDYQREAEQAKRAAAHAAKVEAGVRVPEGKVTVTGTVISTKWVDNDFGGNLKMLVESDQGWKVWGTVPSAIEPAAGDRVRFNATVTPSKDDPLFGFYKRPTKPALLTPTATAA